MEEGKVMVAAIQMSCLPNNKEANVARALELIGSAAREGAKLAVLPELFTTGYYCFRERRQDLFSQAERIPGPTTRALGEEAREQGLYIVAPLFEQAEAGLYHNTAALIGPSGEVVGKYSKTHIPLSGGALEKYYFRPGSKYPGFQTEVGNLAMLICYDRNFPETFRVLALNGAELVLVPSTIFPRPKASVSEDWDFIAKTRAAENGVFAVFVNRTGREEGLEYFGHSVIVNPQGRIIKQGGFEESVVTATIDLKEVDMLRRRRFYMRDRRPETYSKLVELS